MTTYCLVLIIIYILSFLACWNWTRIAFNKGGIHEYKNLSGGDFLIILVPVLNTVMALVAWSAEYPRKDRGESFRIKKWVNKFFRIK